MATITVRYAPRMGSSLDWLYTAGGWALCAVAVALGVWALFSDRSRGRRRCPKCWYDMRGTPGNRCPECGREPSRESRFHKTKRRWRWAALAAILAVVAYGVHAVPAYWRAGWAGAVPSSVLALFAPAVPSKTPFVFPPGVVVAGMPMTPSILSTSQRLANELWYRLENNRLARWQSQVFIERYLRSTPLDLARHLQLPARWPLNEAIPGVLTPSRLATLDLVAKDDRRHWSSEKLLWFPAQTTRTDGVEILFGYGAGSPAYTTSRLIPISIDGTREMLLEPLSTPEASNLVRLALAPHLSMEQDKPVLIFHDRSSDSTWSAIDFGLVYTFEVRIGNEVVGSGSGKAKWSTAVWKDWDEMAVDWHKGALDQLLRPNSPVSIFVRGRKETATAEYMTWPFDKPRAACWTGEFTMPLEFKEHPGSPAK